MSNVRTIAIAIAIAAVLAGSAALALVAASAAQASDTKASDTKAAARWCTGSDLAIRVDDMRSPSEKNRAHMIRFVSAEGVSCTIGGTVHNARFLDLQGNDIHASQNGGQPPYSETLVGGDSYAATYVASVNDGTELSPAFVRFNLPAKGRAGDLVTIPWPKSGIGSNVRMGGIVAPVS